MEGYQSLHPDPVDVGMSNSNDFLAGASNCTDTDIADHNLLNEDAEINFAGLSPEPLMLVSVNIANKPDPVNALIDTGATMSIIENYLVHNNSVNNTTQNVSGLGNKVIEAIGTADIPVCLGGLTLLCTFLVVPDGTINHSIILGSNFFSKHHISIDFVKKKLSGDFPRGSWEYYDTIGNSPPTLVLKDIPIYCKENTKLSNTEPTLVPVYSPSIDISNINADDDFYYDGNVCKKLMKFAHGQEGLLSMLHGSSSVLIDKHPCSLDCNDTVKVDDCLGSISTIVNIDCNIEVNLAANDSHWDMNKIKDSIKLSNCSFDQSEKVYRMFLENCNVFSKSETDISCAGVTQHCIELTDTTPIRLKPRRFPEPVVNEIENQCDKLRDQGIIQYSRSPWSSQVVPVIKPNGSVHLCIDYRKLNKVTKADRFPMPNISDMVYNLHGTKFFSSIDLTQGFYQVPLHPECTEYTAFSTSRNHYEFKRLPFGLKNAPTAFQREMQAILHEFDTKGVIIYIDDILIMSEDFDSHYDLVSRVLHTLDLHQVKIKLNKCSFFQTEVKFLGHLVGSHGIKKSEEFMKSVSDFPQPKLVSDLRSFLGLVNFQRKFIPQCSALAKPLTQWMSKPDKCIIDWSESMIQAFNTLKELTCKNIELAYPNYSQDAPLMELSTDASQYGAGACLSQLQDGHVRVIGYASTTFNKAEIQYSTIDRELAAIRWALGVFRGFIYGIPFILYTDHRPLVYMCNMSKFNHRIMRTMNDLAQYQFEIRYRAGKDNTIADILSRLDCYLPEDDIVYNPNDLPKGISLLEKSEGGGNSMIESLMKVLLHHQGLYNPSLNVPASSLELRQLLVDELLNNCKSYGFKLDKTTKSNIKLCSLPDVMPPNNFLLAFSNIFKLHVYVHCGLTSPVIYKIDSSTQSDIASRVHLQCLAMIHYNPCSENRLYESPVTDVPTLKEIEVSCLCESHCELPDDIGLSPSVEPLNSCNHSSGSSPYAKMVMDDVSYCVLLDTGAQISLLSASIWNSFSTEYKESCQFSNLETTIKGIGSNFIDTKGIAHIRFRFNNDSPTFDAPFAIVEGCDLPFCAIIGANVISNLNLQINYASRLFTTSTPDGTYGYPLSTEANNGLVVCLANEVITQPGCLQLSLPKLYDIQQSDHAIKLLISKVKNMIEPKQWKNKCLFRFKRYASNLILDNGVLFCNFKSKTIPVSPFNFIVEVILRIHWDMGHIGRNKLIDLLQANLFHPEIASIAADVCSSCLHCQMVKVSSQVHEPPMLKIQPDGPFSLIAADLMLLPRTSHGYIGLLVVVDHFTKWLSLVPIKNKRANTIAAIFEHQILSKLPAKPHSILTDNGLEFSSEIFNSVLQNYDIKHVYSTPYKPSSNGAVERVNRTVTEMLRCLDCGSDSWDNNLTKVTLTYNNTWHSQLKMSPSEFILSQSHTYNKEPVLSTANLWKEGHSQYVPFKVGDKVLRKIKLIGNLTSNKLIHRYSGIFLVHQANPNAVTYTIIKEKDTNSSLIKVHHSQLKAYIAPPRYILRHSYYNYLMKTYNEGTCASDDSSDSSLEDFNADFETASDSNQFSDSTDSASDLLPGLFTPSNVSSKESTLPDPDFSGFNVSNYGDLFSFSNCDVQQPDDFSGFPCASANESGPLLFTPSHNQGYSILDFSGFDLNNSPQISKDESGGVALGSICSPLSPEVVDPTAIPPDPLNILPCSGMAMPQEDDATSDTTYPNSTDNDYL